MLKAKAIELLGGTVASAAKEIGVSYQAVNKWPDELPPRIEDRVWAALARKQRLAIADGAAALQGDTVTPYGGPERRKSAWKASA
jgi:hypothetical protein